MLSLVEASGRSLGRIDALQFRYMLSRWHEVMDRGGSLALLPLLVGLREKLGRILVVVLVFVDAVVPNLIIVRRAEGARICRTIPLQLPVHSYLAVAIRIVEVARPRLLVDKADDVAVCSAVEEL